VVFVVAGLASMGLPGFSGFPAELGILVGVWKTSPLWAGLAAVGVIVAGAFTLRAIQLAFFGQTGPGGTGAAVAVPAAEHHFAPISLPEKAGAMLLLGATVLVGLKPDLLLDWIRPALESPYFQAVLKGGAP
jgi:NADH-quinone oxidoreductase subunit M